MGIGQEEFVKYFARASKLDESKRGDLTSLEWENKQSLDGVKRLKRRLLGIFGHPFTFGVYTPETIKRLDEIGNILHELNISTSPEKGREIVRSLYGSEIPYSFIGPRKLRFEPMSGSPDSESVRISAHYYGPY